MKTFIVSASGECKAPPRPGTATLTVGRDSVTLGPLPPREDFDRHIARWDELAKRAFGHT